MGADKSLARAGSKETTATENFEFHISCLELQLEEYEYYLYIYSTNIPPIVIINRICETQNFLSL